MTSIKELNIFCKNNKKAIIARAGQQRGFTHDTYTWYYEGKYYA